MKLPGAERARVDAAKVRDYLLSREHPVGRFKAVFFGSLGYSVDTWQQLEADLRGVAAGGEATFGEQTQYGQKYEVHGILQARSGEPVSVVTAWIVRWGEDAPRFVTAYPGEKR